jgi:small subunit ribosomal protein S8
MTMTDPISDMLTRIRNGQSVTKQTVTVPASGVKKAILEVLTQEGYIGGFKETTLDKHPAFEVELKYMDGKPVISEISRLSRPGLRQYVSSKDIPMVRSGLGVAIVSTSQGVLSDAQARSKNLGGELLCQVF